MRKQSIAGDIVLGDVITDVEKLVNLSEAPFTTTGASPRGYLICSGLDHGAIRHYCLHYLLPNGSNLRRLDVVVRPRSRPTRNLAVSRLKAVIRLW